MIAFMQTSNNIYRIVTQGIDKNGGKGRKDPQYRLFTGATFCTKYSGNKIFCSRTKRK